MKPPDEANEETRRLRVQLASERTEVARLRAELDRYQGRKVLHCTDAQLDFAAISALDEPDGTILRATDTGRELLMHAGTWGER